MSFSSRYSKNRSKVLEVPPVHKSELNKAADAQVSSHQSTDETVAVQAPDTHKNFARFLKKYTSNAQVPSKEPSQKAEHASRLVFTKQPDEPNEKKERHYLIGFLKLLFFLLLLLAGVIGWIYRDHYLFPVQRVDLEGQFASVNQVDLNQVLRQYASGSMLFLPLEKLRSHLAALPWVESVQIHRLWPTTLQVQLQQKQAVARFSQGRLLDKQGVLFAPSHLNGTEGLPYIEGPENRADQLWQAYLSLNQLLASDHLKILRMQVSPRLAYVLVLDNGITIYLGSSNITERLLNFAKVYDKTLRARAQKIDYVDTRYNDGIAVGWKTNTVVPLS